MIITITDDFNPDIIIESGQCFRPSKLGEDSWKFITGDKYLTLKKLDDSTYDVNSDEKEWDSIWRPYFDLDRDYRSIRKSIKDDPYLEQASECGKGIRILKQDSWEMLISFIISQRKSIPSIRSCIEKLCTKYGDVLGEQINNNKDKENIYAFPNAESILMAGESGLSDCSLGYRLPYLLDAAEKVSSGELDLNAIASLGDEELFESLKTVKGVGDKVSNCICLFAFARTGRAPVDVWIKRVIDEQYRGVNPFDKYGDSAGIMQQYVFYYAQNKKKVLL